MHKIPFHRGYREIEFGGDFTIGAFIGDQPQHLKLPFAQGFNQGFACLQCLVGQRRVFGILEFIQQGSSDSLKICFRWSLLRRFRRRLIMVEEPLRPLFCIAIAGGMVQGESQQLDATRLFPGLQEEFTDPNKDGQST